MEKVCDLVSHFEIRFGGPTKDQNQTFYLTYSFSLDKIPHNAKTVPFNLHILLLHPCEEAWCCEQKKKTKCYTIKSKKISNHKSCKASNIYHSAYLFRKASVSAYLKERRHSLEGAYILMGLKLYDTKALKKLLIENTLTKMIATKAEGKRACCKIVSRKKNNSATIFFWPSY